jgi:hypothetical protein
MLRSYYQSLLATKALDSVLPFEQHQLLQEKENVMIDTNQPPIGGETLTTMTTTTATCSSESTSETISLIDPKTILSIHFPNIGAIYKLIR